MKIKNNLKFKKNTNCVEVKFDQLKFDDWHLSSEFDNVKPITVYTVKRFMRLVPDCVIEPKVLVTNNGYLGFEWVNGYNNALNVDISGNTVTYCHSKDQKEHIEQSTYYGSIPSKLIKILNDNFLAVMLVQQASENF